MRPERIALGWRREPDRPYLLRSYEEKAALCRQLALESDVVVLGSAPDRWIGPRLRRGRLTFRYAERWYKTGLPPAARVRAWLHHGRFQRAPLYLLCAGAYVAADAAWAGCYRDKAYRFGYFPPLKCAGPGELPAGKPPDGGDLLWAGRFLSWKHPLDAIALAGRLQEAGCHFRMTFVGTGPERQEMERRTAQMGLQNRIQILPPMPPEAVRRRMEQANLFLLTSDFQEGWGAVLNEAMNSGCAVVASEAIGSVPFLIKDGVNGFRYESGNIEDLTNKVKFLLDHPEKSAELGKNAYSTMTEEWNADTAAERFIALASHILSGEKGISLYKLGPCSSC